jgi:caa(3)-type oxidase subunit IV
MKVFFFLVALTIVEVAIPFVLSSNKGLAVTLLISISVVKILTIARYFMHLKFDARVLGLVACAPLVCASIMSIALLWDN